MSWLKATVIGTVAVALAFVLCVEVPDLIVSKMTSLSRSVRADLATGFFTVALVGLLWGMRKGQQWLLDRQARSDASSAVR